ncbi:hypothetical protein GCM10009840_30870 [Pseudolysinimonas kribbensis]|uniref:Uncharacterized protein n=1 Tax=Pseudolysinimonas kribbensis TaxID=433641 RepID=A0ABQ6K9L5_9MICO|nr:hypothetical protein [Pseudolysinimonas kribbensis]GMA96054.1 hypothetical protein GCM10025881_28780 [Pseudolysinimonas kribbensis]
MIVESGYDLFLLLSAQPGTELAMVTLDADLRPIHRSIVERDYDGVLDEGILARVDALVEKEDGACFAVLGHRVSDATGFLQHLDWDAEKALLDILRCRSIDLLGYMGYDSERWATTGPVYRFTDYPLADHVPRTLVVRGPHPFLECRCIACQNRGGCT